MQKWTRPASPLCSFWMIVDRASGRSSDRRNVSAVGFSRRKMFGRANLVSCFSQLDYIVTMILWPPCPVDIFKIIYPIRDELLTRERIHRQLQLDKKDNLINKEGSVKRLPYSVLYKPQCHHPQVCTVWGKIHWKSKGCSNQIGTGSGLYASNVGMRK